MRGFAVRAKIHPARVIKDSLALFLQLENLTRPLKVSFEGEKASDSGGVTTSLYRRFYSEILGDATYFERRGSGSFLPSPSAPLDAMRAVGISISRCLFDERVVDLPLNTSLFKYLLGQQVNIGDLESFDEAQATQLKSLLRCPGVEAMQLTFEFIDPNDDTVVNDLNKELFVARKVEFELIKSREQPLAAIRQGFWSLVALQKPLKVGFLFGLFLCLIIFLVARVARVCCVAVGLDFSVPTNGDRRSQIRQLCIFVFSA